MSTSLKSWTRDQFFAWAETREGRWEFDGFRPVDMTGGTIDHSQITLNIHAALRPLLRGSGCRSLGPDAGVSTVGEAIRNPDAVITCTPVDGTSRLVPNPTTIFEVLSPSSARNDRLIKVREYGAVRSLRRYVMVESAGPGLLVLERAGDGDTWIARALTEADTLVMQDLGIEIPVAAFYEDVAFPPPDTP